MRAEWGGGASETGDWRRVSWLWIAGWRSSSVHAQPRQDTGTVRVWGEVRTVRGVVVVSGLHVPGLPRLAADYARTDVEILRDATLIYGNAGHR